MGKTAGCKSMLQPVDAEKGNSVFLLFFPSLWEHSDCKSTAKLAPSFDMVNILFALLHGEARHLEGAGRLLFSAVACVDQVSWVQHSTHIKNGTLIMNFSSWVHVGCVTGRI